MLTCSNRLTYRCQTGLDSYKIGDTMAVLDIQPRQRIFFTSSRVRSSMSSTIAVIARTMLDHIVWRFIIAGWKECSEVIKIGNKIVAEEEEFPHIIPQGVS